MSCQIWYDVSDESPETLARYGTTGGDGSFAANCLLARRLAEPGVRFIQLYHRAWDHHVAIKKSMEITAPEVDQASATLLTDHRACHMGVEGSNKMTGNRSKRG